MLYFSNLVQYTQLIGFFKFMDIFKRLAARISPVWAFEGLIQAIEDHNQREISWHLPLCSPQDQAEALNHCIKEYNTHMFELLFPRVPSTQNTLDLAAYQASIGQLMFLEHILPAVVDDHKMHALRSLIRWIDDSFVKAQKKWKPSIDLFLNHGIDRNCVLKEAVKLNSANVFEYLFDTTQIHNYGHLTCHLDFYQDKCIVDALIPYASPSEIEHLLNQAAWIGHSEYIGQLASLCDDHSRALAKVIAGSVQFSSKELPFFEQNAQLLYPQSNLNKTLEYLYADHEEFMDNPQSFDNILLKDLHERIETSQQRAVLENAVGESTAAAPRRKM